MNCPNCEKKEDKELLKKYNTYCHCCNGMGTIDFHRHIQWQLGDVLLLNSSGTSDASSEEMNRRCRSIIEHCYVEYNKKGRKVLQDVYSNTPEGVRDGYISQFY